MDTPVDGGSRSRASRLIDRFFPPIDANGPLARASTLVLWLRPVFGGLGVVAGFAFHGTFVDRAPFLHVIWLLFLPYAFGTAALARYRLTPAYRALVLIGDLAVIFTIDYSVPETHPTALFGYMLIVTFAATSTGAVISSAGVLVASGLSAASDMHAGSSGVGAFTLAFFGAALSAMALLVRASTRDLRSRLTHQTRMEVSALTHELRTPLTSIDGFARTLIERWDDIDRATGRFFLERITSNASEMDQLIARILELSRIESGSWTPEKVNERLRPAVENLARTLAPALHDHSVAVEIDGDLSVRVDAFALRRVLGNLLTNAAKFSPAGTAIEVRARARGGLVEIAVVDHGPGIPTGERDRIFDPFYRGSGEGRAIGTGLGLLLARRYVEAQGGGIRMEPGADGGSVFTITLPAATPTSTASENFGG